MKIQTPLCDCSLWKFGMLESTKIESEGSDQSAHIKRFNFTFSWPHMLSNKFSFGLFIKRFFQLIHPMPAKVQFIYGGISIVQTPIIENLRFFQALLKFQSHQMHIVLPTRIQSLNNSNKIFWSLWLIISRHYCIFKWHGYTCTGAPMSKHFCLPCQ